ncbi:InlB B-repeat-containing protein [Raoultibacter timonensis]|uniref:Repeat protein (TIGR02543 family) n=1 Tax=Raoultibacter timonensis TaxID=1907662 RepID=A0ABN6MC71_9ACTN|nr:InlB B-repeat-containing protein [Raoultibacter timonensis]BDE95595.1 hypothetical protein CE91St30_09280 [Raoultibacter timonensis]BDF50199.1 hypothetical protein CE91St31_09290 [Raoultibacter timonensis]
MKRRMVLPIILSCILSVSLVPIAYAEQGNSVSADPLVQSVRAEGGAADTEIEADAAFESFESDGDNEAEDALGSPSNEGGEAEDVPASPSGEGDESGDFAGLPSAENDGSADTLGLRSTDGADADGSLGTLSAEDFVVSGGIPEIDYRYQDGVLELLNDGAYRVSLAEGTSSTQDTIKVGSGVVATLTLHNVAIDNTGRADAGGIVLDGGAAVILVIEGACRIAAGSGAAGVLVPVGAALTVENPANGLLSVKGGSGAAGIGGGASSLSSNSGSISVRCDAIVEAGANAYAIGPGTGGSPTNSVTLPATGIVAVGSVDATKVNEVAYHSNGGYDFATTVLTYSSDSIVLPTSAQLMRYDAGFPDTGARGWSASPHDEVGIGQGGAYTLTAASTTLYAAGAQRDLVVEGATTGYTYVEGTLHISAGGTYTVSMRDGVETTTDNIVVAAAATVTIDGITIQQPSTQNRSCILIERQVNLLIKGSNTLHASMTSSAVRVSSSAKVTINDADDATATLVAQAGPGGKNGGGGAAIGESMQSSAGEIVIEGGTITAHGGDRAPGVGSGTYASNASKSITIAGDAAVKATGGSGSAGIGSGFQSELKGQVLIKDQARVEARGVSTSPGIGSGMYSKFAGSISIQDQAVVKAFGDGAPGMGSGYNGACTGTIAIHSLGVQSSGTRAFGSPTADLAGSRTVAYAFYSAAGSHQTTLNYIGDTATMPDTTWLRMFSSDYGDIGTRAWRTLQEPTLYPRGGDYSLTDALTVLYAVEAVRDLTVKGGVEGADYRYQGDGKLVVLSGAALSVELREGLQATTDRIAVPSGIEARITIENVAIETSSGSPISLATDASLALTLVGDNRLVSLDRYSGIAVPGDADLSIRAGSEGASLFAQGAALFPGIGASGADPCGSIAIMGATVEAHGGIYSAGIGAPYGGRLVGDIVVSEEAVVKAYGSTDGVSIGAGLYGLIIGSISLPDTGVFAPQGVGTPNEPYPGVRTVAYRGDGAELSLAYGSDGIKLATFERLARFDDAFSGSGTYWVEQGQQEVGYPIADGAAVTVAADTVFASGHRVTFDSAGGSAVDDVYAAHGEAVAQPADPSREAYAAAGWTSGGEPWSFSQPIGADLALTMEWNPVAYSITYENTRGTENGNPLSYTVESADIALAPLGEAEGYRFTGWFDAAEGGAEVTAIPSGSKGNVTLYAQWQFVYRLIDGPDRIERKSTDAVFSFTGDISDAVGVSVNGREFSLAQGEGRVDLADGGMPAGKLESGSVVLTLHGSYLDGIENGAHEVKLVFADGQHVAHTFELARADDPDDSDGPSGPSDPTDPAEPVDPGNPGGSGSWTGGGSRGGLAAVGDELGAAPLAVLALCSLVAAYAALGSRSKRGEDR